MSKIRIQPGAGEEGLIWSRVTQADPRRILLMTTEFTNTDRGLEKRTLPDRRSCTPIRVQDEHKDRLEISSDQGLPVYTL